MGTDKGLTISLVGRIKYEHYSVWHRL